MALYILSSIAISLLLAAAIRQRHEPALVLQTARTARTRQRSAASITQYLP